MRKQSSLENISKSVEANSRLKIGSSEHDRYQINNVNYKKTLIYNAPYLFTCDKNDKLKILENHSIAINNGIIKSVAPAKKTIPKGFDIVYDASKRGGIVVTPGLINTHAHIHMYLLRSAMMLDEGESIDETIAAMARWQKFDTDEDHTIACIGDITEQQKHGITTTLTHGPNFSAVEEATRATNHVCVNAVSAISNSRPDNTPEAAEKYLKQKNTFSIPAISLHYLYKAPDEVLKKIKKLQKKYKALLTFHMAESEYVSGKTVEAHGRRETGVLKKYGLLNSQSLASHVLHVTDKEIAELAKSKVGIAHLPTSNLIHKSGTFKFWDFEAAGAFPRLSLGTDSVVSKNRLDILTEAYQTRVTHLYRKTVKFSSLFKMMTANGARVLNMKDRGKIIAGHKADICFWKLKDRGCIPYDKDNPVTLLGNIITHGGRYVRDLMINGKFVIKDRKHVLIDESKLLEEIQKAHISIRKRIG